MMQLNRNFDPQFIPYKISNEDLTSSAGLQLLLEALDQSFLKKQFADCLPSRVSPRSKGAYSLGLTQLASFLKGHDCIEDLEKFRKDPSLSTLLSGESVAARTMLDFLKDFELDHIGKLNQFLSVQAKAVRVQLEKMLKKQYKPAMAPHLSIDSTSHVQSGLKMEGLAYNYKDEWCLDSQVIFDELGLCWNFKLRPGNTKSGVGAGEQIKQAFHDYKFSDEKYLSADSAYCNQEVMKTCLGLGVKFTITANQATTGWQDQLGAITKWEEWQYSKEQIEDAQIHQVELPKIELGRFYWRPSWSDTLRLPIVVKRSKATGQLELGQGEYKYYGVVTDLALINWSLQEVMEHHNKRGNAENFIRDGKYGYDLKHFPSRKLIVNEAFGLLAWVAHNLLRWAAIHDNPKRPKFAKRFRDQFVNIPGKIVSHARQLCMKIPIHFLEEVNRLRTALELKPYPPILATG
jgi:DDE family transposase